jgi:hypothetical protein
MLLVWTCLVLSVIVDAHRFKRAPPSIEYWSFRIFTRMRFLKKRIMQYHKFNTKVLIFTILKNSKTSGLHSYIASVKNGRKFKIIKKKLFEGNTQLL